MLYNSVLLQKRTPLIKNLIVDVPYSKSISNRLLVIRHLAGSNATINNLSDSDDTQMLNQFLQQIENKKNNTFNCKNAGTTFRFLLALLSVTEGKWELFADKRMWQRPVLPLVDVLNSLGADIRINHSGEFFVVTIIGKKLVGNKTIEIKENLTSQIVSALLLISPNIEGELSIVLPHLQTSMPYIDMTISLINKCNGQIRKMYNQLVCRQSRYFFNEITIEKDFSCVSFFYLYVYAGKLQNIRVNHLQTSILQADAVCVNLFKNLGILTLFDEKGAVLSYEESLVAENQELEFDLLDCPDLFCPIVVASYLSDKKVFIKNIASLRVKESNRIENMIKELNKLGDRCKEEKDCVIIDSFDKDGFVDKVQNSSFSFNTYNDHRIAMSLSAISFVCKEIEIENPNCVEKSFVDFWRQAEKFFTICYQN